jgi:hypothetical protein
MQRITFSNTGLFAQTRSPLTFESIVASKAAELGSTGKAIAWAVRNHPGEHKRYLARVAAGEKIDLTRPITKPADRFEDIVAKAERTRRRGKADAISWAVQNHPAAHKSFLARCYAGERTTL